MGYNEKLKKSLGLVNYILKANNLKENHTLFRQATNDFILAYQSAWMGTFWLNKR